MTNDGTAVPAANILNVPGNNTAFNGFAAWTTGTGSTLKVNVSAPYKWVVNPIAGVGTHQTIQAALNAASSGDAIFVCPGTYTENLTPLVPVSLIASAQGIDNGLNQQTIIKGKFTHTISGLISFTNFHFQTNGDYIYYLTGVNACIASFNNCFFDMQDFSGLFASNTSSSSSINLFYCRDNINFSGAILFNCSFVGNVGGNLNIYDHDGYNSAFSNNPSVMVSGTLIIDSSRFLHGISVGASASCLLEEVEIDTTLNASSIATCLTISTTSATANFCSFYSLTSSAITVTNPGVLSLSNCTVNSSNSSALVGSGTLNSGGLIFSGSSTLNNVSTQAPFVRSNDAVEVVRPAAYPYTVKAQDEVISIDTSGAAPTVTLPLSPVNGQKHTVKDRSANAAASNITVSGNGHNIVGTTSAATQTISLNGAAVTYVYDSVGTVWLAI